MQYKDIRKRGKLYAFIYLLGILTVRWYWWIFLTRGEMSLNNQQNAHKLKKVIKTDNIISRFWKRGSNNELKEALNETKVFYDNLEGDSISKYRKLIQWTYDKYENTTDPQKSDSFRKISNAYKQIINKFTGHSMFVDILPSSFIERIVFFFNKSISIPMPDNIFPVRNLTKNLSISKGHNENIVISNIEENRINGNIIELFLLSSKEGDPICVADKEPLQLTGTLTRAGNIDKADKNLKI
ncbi:MAG: hypothetical protein GY756_21635, partial [bacterium]|nr:hypothetical protein [bacterium]